MSSEDDKLEDLVRFGAMTEQFLKGPIGKYLLDRSAEEIDAALQLLKKVDPHNVPELRRLQNEIARNESVEQWLREIIHAGWEARAELSGEEP
jgi:hypothetical protein